MTRTRSSATLILFIGICLGVGAGGAWATASSVTTWYPSLAKPAWTPPGAVFGPVWTVLYILIGIAGWTVWMSDRPGRRSAMTPFAAQLALNAAWSFLFFGMRHPGWAAIEIVLLWLAIVWTTIVFRRIRALAAALLLPYLAWVSFAAALNFAIWRLNP